MTVRLEQTGQADAAQRNFDRLSALTPDFGGVGVSMRSGVATLTWTAAAQSATLLVTHGLGRAPAQVFVSPRAFTGPGATWMPFGGVLTATTFSAVGVTTGGGAVTGTGDFYWLVIG